MIRTILVDDEPPARQILREYLEGYSEISVISECSNGLEALEQILDQKPDLIFLDVNMPEMSGFEVLDSLPDMPYTIFSTAYDDFAVKAFDAGAVDYLLKPYSRTRFATAMDRFFARHREGRTNEEDVAALRKELQSGEQRFGERLFVRSGDRIIPVQLDSISWIEAAGDYSQLHTSEGVHLCNLGIGALAARLDPRIFTRVHRSSIVAFSALKHLLSDGEGGYIATLTTGQKVRVSRTYAPGVRDLIA